MKAVLITLLLFAGITTYGQDHDSLFSRLSGLSIRDMEFFDVDGIEITTQTISMEFSKKHIPKEFKRYKIKERDLNTADSLIKQPNFYILRSDEVAPGLVQTSSCYFVEHPGKGVTAFTFGSINKNDRDFERLFIQLILNNNIPKSVYDAVKIDSINFAGRKIPLGSSCSWKSINNVQCPSYGQMNWSVHKTLEDAAQSVTNQMNVIKARKVGKFISEELVDVIFEGSEVKAKKTVFDFKGVTGLLAGMSGGKTLTIYFVSAPVRRYYVSCVMSFWNNDIINPSGLSPLLEQVMKLKK
jgi:hypothetical protein